MGTIIQVDNLSKKYIIKHQENYGSIREEIMNNVKKIGKKVVSPFASSKNATPTKEEFWALKDVSFKVEQGERIGIIGRNGAGKSTILKVLSRITEPTMGRVWLKGRVASLLEVGTGFHAELTGRENIYLNGAILGMTKAEIDNKFDEIVAFAEVEKFLDTPVKRYSSGMTVRLAFAVAAHMEPDILIVDEVLAVGDVQFQKKCLGKMEEVGKQGRTIFFVSHNMAAIQTLCTSVLLMDSGRIIGQGNVNEQIDSYLKFQQTKEGNSSSVIEIGPYLQLNKFEFTPNPVESCVPVKFDIELASTSSLKIAEIGLLIYSSLGVRVAFIDLRHSEGPYKFNGENLLIIRGSIPNLPLVEGDYQVGLFIYDGRKAEDLLNLVKLSVTGRAVKSKVVPHPAKNRGFVEIITDLDSIIKFK